MIVHTNNQIYAHAKYVTDRKSSIFVDAQKIDEQKKKTLA